MDIINMENMIKLEPPYIIQKEYFGSIYSKSELKTNNVVCYLNHDGQHIPAYKGDDGCYYAPEKDFCM